MPTASTATAATQARKPRRSARLVTRRNGLTVTRNARFATIRTRTRARPRCAPTVISRSLGPSPRPKLLSTNYAALAIRPMRLPRHLCAVRAAMESKLKQPHRPWLLRIKLVGLVTCRTNSRRMGTSARIAIDRPTSGRIGTAARSATSAMARRGGLNSCATAATAARNRDMASTRIAPVVTLCTSNRRADRAASVAIVTKSRQSILGNRPSTRSAIPVTSAIRPRHRRPAGNVTPIR